MQITYLNIIVTQMQFKKPTPKQPKTNSLQCPKIRGAQTNPAMGNQNCAKVDARTTHMINCIFGRAAA